MKRAEKNRTERIVGFRATTEELQRLDAIAAKTGMPYSDIFRALIEQADATPVVAWLPTLRIEQGRENAGAVQR